MIAALTGRADDFELVFSCGQDGLWRASVPPDLSDGQYVVTLCAVNDAGESATYRGVLYLSGGVCRIVLSCERYRLSLLPEPGRPLLLPEALRIETLPQGARVLCMPERVQIQMRRCTHGTGVFTRRRKMA